MKSKVPPLPRLSNQRADFPAVQLMAGAIKIIHLPLARAGLVSLRLLFAGGADSDGPEQSGCCALADELMALHLNRSWRELPFGGDVCVSTGWASSTVAIDGHQSELLEMAALMEAFLSIRHIDGGTGERT